MSEKKITAKQLTSSVGLSASAITEWKKGKAKPSAAALQKIAAYLDCSVDYLLGNTTDPTPAHKKSISDAQASEILRQKFIQHGIIKEGDNLTDEQLEDYLKKLSTILSTLKD